jgi:hypothetical protein
MSRLTSIASWRRSAASAPDRTRLDRRAAPDDLLTSLLAFSATGLFASCLALAMEHEIPHVAVLELVLICVAPACAALAGLLIVRRR